MVRPLCNCAYCMKGFSLCKCSVGSNSHSMYKHERILTCLAMLHCCRNVSVFLLSQCRHLLYLALTGFLPLFLRNPWVRALDVCKELLLQCVTQVSLLDWGSPQATILYILTNLHLCLFSIYNTIFSGRCWEVPYSVVIKIRFISSIHLLELILINIKFFLGLIT